MKKALLLSLMGLVLMILSACQNNIEEPAIMSLGCILPEAAAAGDSITLTGSGFGEEQGDSRVLFGDVAAASYSFWNDSTIVVTVPEFTATVDVTVEISGVGSNPLPLSRGSDENTAAYELLSVYPSSGVAGDVVILSGTLFTDTREQSNVYFGGVPAVEYELWSNSTIIAVVPDAAQSSSIHICVEDVDSNQLSFDVLPSIDSIQPGAVSCGDVISVIGTGFGDSQQSLFIGDTEFETFYSWTNQVIVAQVPLHASVGANNVYVQKGDSISESASLNVLWDSMTTLDGLSYNSSYGILIEDDKLWVSTWGGGLNYSSDDGLSWQVFNTYNGLPTNYIRQVELYNDDIWAAANIGVCTSDDDGASWTNFTTTDGLGNNYVLTIAVDNNTGRVWAGSNNGGISKIENGESSFTTYTTADGLAGNYVYDIFVESDSTVWAATNGGLSVSEDGGDSWTNFTTIQGLSGNSCRAVSADDSTVWVGTTTGLSKSTDDGQTWTRFSSLDGLGGNYCLSIAVDADTVWLGTNGYGLSRSEDDGNTWEVFTTGDGLVSNTVRAVSAYDQGIAAATNAGISTAWK